MSADTNAETAAFATERSALPLRRLTLIGVMGTEEARRALLRRPSGQIERVQVGDVLRHGTVVAISEDAITLAAPNGKTTVMQLPARDTVRSAA